MLHFVNAVAALGVAFGAYTLDGSVLVAVVWSVAVWVTLSDATPPHGEGAANMLLNLAVHGLWIAAFVYPFPAKRLLVVGLAVVWYGVVSPVGFLLWPLVARFLTYRAFGFVPLEGAVSLKGYAGALTSVPRILVSLCLLYYCTPLAAFAFGGANHSIWLIPVGYCGGAFFALVTLAVFAPRHPRI